MRSVIRSDKVLVRAPAKVNLLLEVLGKRNDGYHEIATLMVAIRLMDTLIFEEAPGLRLRCSRADLSTGADNLVMRAARLLKERTGYAGGADITLIKRIPMAAGLAGGSTDAAATLWGLNQLWKTGLAGEELAALGGQLGSDIPFFFHVPAAWCTGRGEIVRPLPLGRPLDLVLLCPSFGCPTAEVYRHLAPTAYEHNEERGLQARKALAEGAIEKIGQLLHNSLQPAAEIVAPALKSYYRRLAETGPAGQLMSGSGSCLFALARDRPDAERIARELRGAADRESFTVILVRSCS